MTELFQITAQYSNAVLVAILPYVTDAAKRLDLPITQPVTAAHVASFRCDPRKGEVGGWLVLTNEYQFWFSHGYVDSVESPNCYFHSQNPDEIPRFFGKSNCTTEEAIRTARSAVAKLGYSVSAIQKQEPEVTPPPKMGTNTVPRYRLRWYARYGEGNRTLATVEVNAENRRIEQISLRDTNFWKAPPKVSVVPPLLTKATNATPVGGTRQDPVSVEMRNQILRKAMPEFSAFAKRLSIPVTIPGSTNHLKELHCGLISGKPSVHVTLTNGYQFSFKDGEVRFFSAPDAFFTDRWKEAGLSRESFVGAVPKNRTALVDLARSQLKATGYFSDTRFLEKEPWPLGGPSTNETAGITRFMYVWMLPNAIPESQLREMSLFDMPTATVEVDARNHTVKYISINRKD